MCETAAGLHPWSLGLCRGIIRALDISKNLSSEYVIRERTQLRHATPTQPYDPLLPDIGILVLQLLRERLLQHRGGEPNRTHTTHAAILPTYRNSWEAPHTWQRASNTSTNDTANHISSHDFVTDFEAIVGVIVCILNTCLYYHSRHSSEILHWCSYAAEGRWPHSCLSMLSRAAQNCFGMNKTPITVFDLKVGPTYHF